MKKKEGIVFKGTPAEAEAALAKVFSRKKILFLVDNHNWCWTNSCKNIAANLPEFESEVATAAEFKQSPEKYLAGCDLVYMRGYPDIFLKDLPDKELKKPWLWTLSTGGANLEKRIEQSREYAACASACIVQNKAAFDAATREGWRNIALIPNGIDTDHFAPKFLIPEAPVGFAGNNKPGAREDLKGTGYVKSACEKLKKEYREVTLDRKLTYNQMPGFYNSIQIYAQPSSAEGCSNSVMEAMACGLPCLICEGVGYHGEVCRDGIKNRDGEVVFVKRNVVDLVKKIDFLLKNPEIYRRISKNARKFAENHAWKNVIGRYRDVILKCLVEWKMPEITRKECRNCRFYVDERKIRDNEDNLIAVARCNRFPPCIPGSSFDRFPLVKSKMLCSEWQKK